MSKIVIAALIALLPATSALAQSKRAIIWPAIGAQPAATPKAQPEQRAKACAEYGSGFKPIEGTGTCVKIGGYVRMQNER